MVRPTPRMMLLLALVQLAFSARAEVEIPFQFQDGFIAIQATVEGHDPKLNLLLDSGASVSLLSTKTAARLKIGKGRRLSVRAIGSNAVVHQIRPLHAHASGASLCKFELAADLTAADKFCSMPIDGLVGVEFFRARVVEIDFPSRVLRLHQTEIPSNGARIPLRLHNDVLCALVGVNGSMPRWTRLDTGCNEALHWVVPKRMRATAPHSMGSIGFASTPSELARVSVTLADREFRSTDAVLHGRPIFPGESGLLGMGLLSRFSRVIVDWEGRALTLQD